MNISDNIYPRSGDKQTIYLKSVISNPKIEVGDYTIYNDFNNDPTLFEKNNVLYHYPVNHDKLVIGKFCSIACGARFLFNGANHTMGSLHKAFCHWQEEFPFCDYSTRCEGECRNVQYHRNRKENGLNPFALIDIFETAPNLDIKNPDHLDLLLPYNFQPADDC